MTEKPILFSGAMVKAILNGSKTQTRRVIKPQLPEFGWESVVKNLPVFFWKGERFIAPYQLVAYSPYGQPGDRLWVRETWAVVKSFDHLKPSEIPKGSARWPVVWYAVPEIAAASIKNTGAPVGKTRHGIFMPRWASRLTLEITGVKVERLQDISRDDAIAEGIKQDSRNGFWLPGGYDNAPELAYRDLWDSINAKRGYGWQVNPWVWVINFKKVGDQ